MSFQDAARGFLQEIDGADLRHMPTWRAWLVGGIRALRHLVGDATSGQLSLFAMGLVYTTLLAVVPLLALSFSVLHAFGVHNAVEPLLLNMLEPLGPKGEEIAGLVVQFVDNINVGVLGFIGLIFLLFTAVGLIQKVESAFNHIWHVTRPRGFMHKFTSYLSVILIGPVLVFSALGMTASLMASDWMQQAMDYDVVEAPVTLAMRMLPLGLLALAFTFVYVFIPNTRVRLLPAVIGGSLAAALWQFSGMGFAAMMAGSTRYDAIYSSFAIMILLLIWLHLSWLILLVGSNISFYLQHPSFLLGDPAKPVRLSPSMQERLALNVMQVLASRFISGEDPPSVEELAGLAGLPEQALAQVLDALQDAGIVIQAGGEHNGRLLPGRDLDQISLAQIVDSVRVSGSTLYGIENPRGDANLDDIYHLMDDAREAVLQTRSLKSLVTQT